MTLLDNALQASGGLDRWRKLQRLTVHLSIEGALFRRMHGRVLTKDVVVEGGVHDQGLEITGFTAPDRRALYRPDRVALEQSDGQLVAERHAAPSDFRRALKAGTWDELLLAFYCGSLIRTYLDLPFVLAEADVVITEDSRLRALHVRFPERLAAHAAQSTLYFDAQAQLLRQEYVAPHAEGMAVAQTYSGYQRYSGLLVPTLCQLVVMSDQDAVVRASASLVDIEIFDAVFE